MILKLIHFLGCGIQDTEDNSLFCFSILLTATSFKLLFNNLLGPTNRCPPTAAFRASTCLADGSSKDLITASNIVLRIWSVFLFWIFQSNNPVRAASLSFICMSPASRAPATLSEDLGSCSMYLATMCWALYSFSRTPFESTIASEQYSTAGMAHLFQRVRLNSSV